MRSLLERFATFYGTPHQSLAAGSIGYLTLIFGLQAPPLLFGILVTLAALAVSWRAAGASLLERTPPLALLVTVSLSGVFNDFRLTGVVAATAVASTPLIVAVGNKGSSRTLRRNVRMVVAWLPASLSAASLTILTFRASSSVALLLSLVYIHDLGLGLGMRDRPRQYLAPLLGLVGALVLLWASIQLAVTPISPRWFLPIAALVAVAIPLGRVVTRMVSADSVHDLQRFSSHLLVTPVWVVTINFLFV